MGVVLALQPSFDRALVVFLSSHQGRLQTEQKLVVRGTEQGLVLTYQKLA